MACRRARAWPGAIGVALLLAAGAVLLPGLGCQQMVRQTDRDVAALIAARQKAVLGRGTPAEVGGADALRRPPRSAYARNPSPPTTAIPAGFSRPASQPASQAASQPGALPASAPTSQAASQPARQRGQVFTLTDALAYAQQRQRDYQSAKETLYLAALDLTLERHLWTPIFASNLTTVYGNYGEVRKFDQAMRFVADLGVTQRLPYGGEFTANAISTLIRDVKNTLTASEGSNIALGLKVPFLRGAGHVAQEKLILLERELTYAVRVFERFRRNQLVTVATGYFGLLAAKQAVYDSRDSFERLKDDYARAQAIESTGQGKKVDTWRAQINMLDQENSLARAREDFRAQADEFKLLIGMPIDEPLGLDDVEDIETIERKADTGTYPLLAPPAAVADDALAVEVALEQRFDLLTARDQIDDARRGVEISRNALLPDLNWDGSLTFDTDPQHYSLSRLSFDRANWKTQVTFGLPLERTAERNALRSALISVQRAQRTWQDQAERIRSDVRRVLNRLRLQERSLEIQRQRVFVAEQQRGYAQYEYEQGRMDNRDKLDAEQAWSAARNTLNQAKTTRWGLLLQFRQATETLRVDEDGVQERDPNMP